jgi:hypothetical protein
MLGKTRAAVQTGMNRESHMANEQAPKPRTFAPNAVHLVRTTQMINVSLSQMADQKASILMGATFVSFTIGIGQASKNGLTVSLTVLIAFAFMSAMLAVFAIMPSVRPKANTSTNILFFGYFTKMSEEEYVETLLERLETDEGFYRTMMRDIYQNGQVLEHKKYKFLGYAYRMFLSGLTITALCFALERMHIL